MRYADNVCSCIKLYQPERYIFTGPCIVTKEEISVTVPAEEVEAYREGKLIQDAMPSLSADEREFLISGMSGEAFDRIMEE